MFADPNYRYGLARHGDPRRAADFVMFSRFTNDIGIGMTNLLPGQAVPASKISQP